MINIEDVELFHNQLIDNYGGSKGIRDRIGLESAINRPFMTFDLKDLYPTSLEKAAAILESLIINHPFIDGNKRIAITMAGIILLNDRLTLTGSEQERYDFVISASMGELRYEGILEWLKQHAVKIS